MRACPRATLNAPPVPSVSSSVLTLPFCIHCDPYERKCESAPSNVIPVNDKSAFGEWGLCVKETERQGNVRQPGTFGKCRASKQQRSLQSESVFPSTINSMDEGQKCTLSSTTVELVLLHAMADWRLNEQRNWARKSCMFSSPLISARPKRLPVAELVRFRSKRKESPPWPIGAANRTRSPGPRDCRYPLNPVFFQCRSPVCLHWLQTHRRDNLGTAAVMWHECTGAQCSTGAAIEGTQPRPDEGVCSCA